jgi:histidine triad (HIT) family protein
MDNCLFCKIIAGEIPAQKVYEDEKVVAILDIKPVNPGHVLVLPKEHFADIFETPDDLLTELIKVVKKIGMATKKAIGADGINIGINNGLAAGQLIFHTHIHVMPRIENDGHQLFSGKDYALGEMEAMGEKIRKELGFMI